MDIAQFTGELGGIAAGGVMTGFGLGWLACIKWIATPAKQTITDLRTELQNERSELKALNMQLRAAFWQKLGSP